MDPEIQYHKRATAGLLKDSLLCRLGASCHRCANPKLNLWILKPIGRKMHPEMPKVQRTRPPKGLWESCWQTNMSPETLILASFAMDPQILAEAISPRRTDAHHWNTKGTDTHNSRQT